MNRELTVSNQNIEFIASEIKPRPAVMAAMGRVSPTVRRGSPGKRHTGGCVYG